MHAAVFYEPKFTPRVICWHPPPLQDTWVTVFGFGPSDLPLVIREFSKAGDIAQVGARGRVARIWRHSCCRSLCHALLLFVGLAAGCPWRHPCKAWAPVPALLLVGHPY